MYDNKNRKKQEISTEIKDRLRALSLDPESPPLTVAEAAKLTNTSQKFWRNKIYNREIEYLKIGRVVRITVIEIVRVVTIVIPFILKSDEVEID